jgi:hypothetical protein
MRFKEFQQVALAKDVPEKKLRRGDLATSNNSARRCGSEREWQRAVNVRA